MFAQRFTQELPEQPDLGPKTGLHQRCLGRRDAHGSQDTIGASRRVNPMPDPNGASPLKRESARLTEGDDRAPARAMLRAIGFSRADLAKPLIGVGHSWIETMPCNYNHRRLSEKVKAGIRAAGGTPMEFNTSAVSAGRMTRDELREIEEGACPGAGACGGQFTANTMATAIEFLGISPAGSNDVPALDPHKDDVAEQAGRLVMELIAKDVRPRQIVTRAALENAIASVAATGGSTNGVLHLLAIARGAGAARTIDGFGRGGARRPGPGPLKPAGEDWGQGPPRRAGLPPRGPRLGQGGR